MYLITADYFIRELEVPNANGASQTRSGAKTVLEQYGDEMPRKILTDSLGYVLAAELEGNTTDGVLNMGAPVKWQNLVNGVIYTIGGESYKWDGLIYPKGIMKKSLLANYTFYEWLKDNATKLSGNGEVIVNTTNASLVSPSSRFVNAYNGFLNMYQGDYLSDDERYRATCLNRFQRLQYPYYDSYDGCYYNSKKNANKVVSLLTFLSQNSDDYADAALTNYGSPINRFSI